MISVKVIFAQVIFAEEMVFSKENPSGPIKPSFCSTIHKIRLWLSHKDSKLCIYIWITPPLQKQMKTILFPSCVYFPQQFLVFTTVFFWAFLSVPLVDCSIDLQQESWNELSHQFVHLAKKCYLSRDIFMMRLHHLTDRNVTCNDGTPAG